MIIIHNTFNLNDSEVVICITVLLKIVHDLKVWTIYNFKIENSVFVTESGRKFTIGVKVEINVKK